MRPAVAPRDAPAAERLLVVDLDGGALADRAIADLPSLLRRGDVLVVNDGATLPASLVGAIAIRASGVAVAHGGGAIELRLAQPVGDDRFLALAFGAGSWRDRTEDRGAAPQLEVGDALAFDGLIAVVTRVDPASPRLVEVRFDRAGGALWSALYKVGRPIQYAYVARPLELWDVQTRYASRPWCAEMPSAGRPLTWGVLLELVRRGVEIARVTHAAGLSSTGDAALDARLPLGERYEIPAETVDAIARARGAGGRVVAAGTTVARALEGCAAAHGGELVAGAGTTTLRLDEAHPVRVVDALLTGMHEPSESHYQLLQAFAPKRFVAAAHEHATRAGYLTHEFGDSSLYIHAR
ncbi:MAG TPA: S-adenosylmethionine:tRNA ribosyltransferase-isomerase [Byssovorax sp.]